MGANTGVGEKGGKKTKHVKRIRILRTLILLAFRECGTTPLYYPFSLLRRRDSSCLPSRPPPLSSCDM